MSIKIWNSIYPAGIDDTSDLGIPNLINNTDDTHASQIHEPRNAIIALETIVGTDAYESGSIRYILENMTLDYVYNNQTSVRVIDVNDQPISFYGNQEIRFDGGPIRIVEQNDPTNIDNYGFLYVKEIDGYSELCYLDNYGNVAQIVFKGINTDPSAIHKNVASEISTISSVIPVGTDYLLIEDANDSNNKKHILVSDIISTNTKGDIFTYDTNFSVLSLGPDGYLLSADSSESTGLKWIENIAGTDVNAFHVNIASEISSLSHVSPAGNDYLLIEDANDSNDKKSINISDIIPVTTKGDIFIYSTTYDRFPIGSDGYLLSSNSSESAGLEWISSNSSDVNAIHDNIAGEISSITSATPASADYLLIEDADDSNNKKYINISDISPLSTKGDLFVFGSSYDRLPIGTNNYILSVNSSESLGLEWIENTMGDDGYLYLEEQIVNPLIVDDYGVIYAKEVEGYGPYTEKDELFYLDDYDGYTQITDRGIVYSFLGHSEEALPTNTEFNEEWRYSILDPKWGWERFDESDDYGISIVNDHAIIQVNGTTDVGTDYRIARSILQDAPLSGDWIAYTKLDFMSSSTYYYHWVGIIALRYSGGYTDPEEFVVCSFKNSYSYIADQYVDFEILKKDLSGNSSNPGSVFEKPKSWPKILCMKYTSSTQTIDYMVAFDSDLSILYPIGTATSVLTGYPDKIGLYFKSTSSVTDITLVTTCEWFRVKLL